jgi:hypothetical protein
VAAFAVFLVCYAVRSRAYWAGGRLPRSVAFRTALGAVITLSGIASGVLVLIGLGWGEFLVVPVFLGGVVLGIANTWSILMAPEVEELPAPTERPTSPQLPRRDDPAGSRRESRRDTRRRSGAPLRPHRGPARAWPARTNGDGHRLGRWVRPVLGDHEPRWPTRPAG